MKTLQSFLRLIRFRNLLIVALTQIIVFICIFWNASIFGHSEFLMDISTFILLVMSTLLITAAGYIINDYFDIKIDAINRPQAALVAHIFPRKAALVLHFIFSISGLLLGAFVAYKIENYWLILIQILTITLLWFYSTHFKAMIHIGNIVVSFLTALSIFIVWLYNPYLYQNIEQPIATIGTLINPFYLVSGISILAFLLNWMREIVKDIEDYDGDEAHGCRTLPIEKGIKYAINFATKIGWVIVVLLSLVVAYFIIHGFSFIKIIVTLLPIIYLFLAMMKLENAKVSKDFCKVSRALKIIMLQSLLVIVIVSFS